MKKTKTFLELIIAQHKTVLGKEKEFEFKAPYNVIKRFFEIPLAKESPALVAEKVLEFLDQSENSDIAERS